jgi:Zn-dependent protease
MAQIEREPADPKTEFWVGIIGPISSAVIGAICLGLARLTGWSGGTPDTPLGSMFMWLGFINLMLAAFNLIPGFPLDGGRILRAIIWWITKNGERATLLAARTGQAFGFLFITFGILRYFTGAGFGGLWTG